MSDKEAASDDLVREFQEALSRHGYGFQFAVIQEIERLRYSEEKTGWHFEVSEFPVHVQGQGTRIDFVLRYFQRRFYLLAECKRVNPAFGNWLFVRAPESSLRRRSSEAKGVRLQLAQWDTAGNRVLRAGFQNEELTDKLFHVGVPVASRQNKGDKSGKSDSDAIEQAASQVCRGLNGLLEWACSNKEWLAPNTPVTMMPVIFTTANLYVTEADLSSNEITDIKTGKVDLSSVGATREPWLFYQYDQSPGLIARSGTHVNEQRDRYLPMDLSEAKLSEYTRTIGIVNFEGILGFLHTVGRRWHY